MMVVLCIKNRLNIIELYMLKGDFYNVWYILKFYFKNMLNELFKGRLLKCLNIFNCFKFKIIIFVGYEIY